jgi:hypothetical protein
MAVDQGIADAKGKLGAAYRFKRDNPAALENARRELAAATLYRDIRKGLSAGLTQEQRREAMRILNGKA